MREKNQTEHYLKIPYHILNLQDIGLCEKVLLSHIFSFGEKGCYQSNETLAKIFMNSPSTISRWLANIRKYLYVKCPKGYYRTFWAKSNPDVQIATKLYWRGKEIPKPANFNKSDLTKSAQLLEQKCATDIIKNEFRPVQKCATTNNNTIKETIRETTTPPTPLPARGQASAVLKDRQAGQQSQIEVFKRGFGKPRPVYTPLPEKQFEERKRQVLAGLGGTEQTVKNKS
jgi:hypothetical protein